MEWLLYPIMLGCFWTAIFIGREWKRSPNKFNAKSHLITSLTLLVVCPLIWILLPLLWLVLVIGLLVTGPKILLNKKLWGAAFQLANGGPSPVTDSFLSTLSDKKYETPTSSHFPRKQTSKKNGPI